MELLWEEHYEMRTAGDTGNHIVIHTYYIYISYDPYCNTYIHVLYIYISYDPAIRPFSLSETVYMYMSLGNARDCSVMTAVVESTVFLHHCMHVHMTMYNYMHMCA